MPVLPKSRINAANNQNVSPAKLARKPSGLPLFALVFCITTSTILSVGELRGASSTEAFGTELTPKGNVPKHIDTG